jgi:outer membrane protein assembly factor BamB
VDSGHSTPVLSNGRILLTTHRAGSDELATVALDRESGRQIWRRAITVEQLEQTHTIGSPATATPACDGKRLFVFFGSYGLICYDLDGNTLWEQRLGPFRDEYGAGSSPVLAGNNVVLNQDHDTESFLAAFDRATGKTVWKTRRPDAVRSYSTPALWNRNGREELLVAGALELAGYDPMTGNKLWSVDGLARIVIPTPIPSGPMIYMASWSPGGDAGRRLELGPWTNAVSRWDKNHDGKLARAEIDDREVLDRFFRMDLDRSGALDEGEWNRHAEVFRRAQNAILALKPSSTDGAQGAGTLIWKYQRGVPYVSTPLLHNGIIWMVKDGGIATKLDAATGSLLQEERLPGPGSYYASPVCGDGKVYIASEAGVVSVVADSREWNVISSRSFQEKIYATPVIHRGRILVRTDHALYALKGPGQAAGN